MTGVLRITNFLNEQIIQWFRYAYDRDAELGENKSGNRVETN